MTESISGAITPPEATGLPLARIRRWLFRTYWKVEPRLAPGLRSSQYEFADTLKRVMTGQPVWLDLGCGRRPFPEWMSEEADEVIRRARWPVGIDLDAASLRDHRSYRDKVLGGAGTLPFRDETFDVVSANMVVEHLDDPAHTLREIHRVLKPGGQFVFHTPSRFHWPLWLSARVPERIRLAIVRFLENRRSEDVFPTHYRMNDERAVTILARETGFDLVHLRFVSTSAVTVMLGPIVLAELLWIRLIRGARFRQLRSNIIAIFRKP